MAPTRARKRNSGSSRNGMWSNEDDQKLISLVKRSQVVNWPYICKFFPNHSQTQVIERWNKVLDPCLLKGSWTRQEDEIIINYVAQYGTKSWTKLASFLPGRIGKQCRERWVNHLNPQISHGPWTPIEDQMLIALHEKFGNHWTKIGAMMPTRSDNSIKNRWNSTLSKRVELSKASTNETCETPAPTPIMDTPKKRFPSISLLTGNPSAANGEGKSNWSAKSILLSPLMPLTQGQNESSQEPKIATGKGLMNLILHQTLD